MSMLLQYALDSINLMSLVAALIVVFITYKEIRFRCRIANVPVVGVPFPGYIGSWIGAVYFIFCGHKVIRRAYTKHKAFQAPMLERMLVFVSSPELIDELCYANPNELSFLEGANDDFQIEYTISVPVKESPWHVPIISDKLTKKIMSSPHLMRDEIHNAFKNVLKVKDGEEWTSFAAHGSTMTIFAQLANRFFVGTGLCRNEEYIKACVEYANDVALGGFKIRIFPRWMKPIVAKFVTKIPRLREIARKFLEPIIKQRRDKMEVLGNKWIDREEDFLQWIMDGEIEQYGNCDDTMDIILRLLFLNFAGIHTTSQMFCVALYQLLLRPEYIDHLREESVAMIARYGYTTAAFNKMSKMDSFMRECSRFVSLGSIITTRKVMVPYKFKDGTFVPSPNYVCAPHHSIHRDSHHYAKADTFDGFRFHGMREELKRRRPNENHDKVGLWTGTANNQLFFGYGKHACPGRFFASLQSKMIFHYLLTTYDMKFTSPDHDPSPIKIQTMYIPNPWTQISFRYRSQDVCISSDDDSDTNDGEGPTAKPLGVTAIEVDGARFWVPDLALARVKANGSVIRRRPRRPSLVTPNKPIATR